jgi:hypothetical protein
MHALLLILVLVLILILLLSSQVAIFKTTRWSDEVFYGTVIIIVVVTLVQECFFLIELLSSGLTELCDGSVSCCFLRAVLGSGFVKQSIVVLHCLVEQFLSVCERNLAPFFIAGLGFVDVVEEMLVEVNSLSSVGSMVIMLALHDTSASV